ncbi:MAG TPA: GNAT family N-acetyltransferase [Longimicrobiaceae bacterium]|nr:GNAT family N-acetyltransferase [Longimicrobiaceae bacterium]
MEIRVEEASLNAWPGLRQLLLDGWLLRFSRGYTKRANSVSPVYASTLPLAEKVALCEERFRADGLPCTFRLTSATAPEGLDALLDARGYRRVDPTLVLSRELEDGGLPGEGDGVREAPLEAWLPLHTRLSGAPPERAATHHDILESIAARRATFALAHGGDEVACGLGVLEGDLFGLFDLVTAPEWRHRGFGTRLVCGMLAWARARGARSAYLQVTEANLTARRLYEKLGFTHLYDYWYRVQPPA